jgi:PAS domain S-box-containing protein
LDVSSIAGLAPEPASRPGVHLDDPCSALTTPPAIIEMLPVAVYACDAAGRLLWFNQRATELWGRVPAINDDAERFCGACNVHFAGRLTPRGEIPMALALRTGDPIHGAEGIIERPDGSRVWVTVHIDPIRNSEGELIGAINCFHDVTAKHELNERLQQSIDALAENEQRLAATYEHAGIAISEIDERGRLLRVNETVCNITGYSRDELLQLTVFDVTHPEDRHRDRDAYRSQIDGARDRYFTEKRLLRRDGGVIWVAIASSTVRDSQGRFRYGIRVMQDITERKEAERRLRDSERQLRELLEALPAAVYTTDAQGRITFFNNAAADLSGRIPQIGSDEWCVTWKLYQPDGAFLPHHESPMATALKENRAIRGIEVLAERPDGSRVPFIPYPTPIRDGDGNLVGAVNMLVDISQRKQAEANQKLLLDELNHRVKNNIQMLHALLRTSERDTENAEAGAVLAEASQRVAAMGAAQQVLYSAANTAAYNPQAFLEALCESSRQSFTAGVDLAIRECASEMLSNNTAMPLALIVNELLTNAVKHGIKGRAAGRINVGLRKDGDSFLLYVEDDGPGFELGEVRKRSCGLGLVLGLARQLGGTFTVERGSGARCIVRFSDQGLH